jgi:hypothetical protein
MTATAPVEPILDITKPASALAGDRVAPTGTLPQVLDVQVCPLCR